ncbi:MAG: hypothetical protein LAO21_17990 [Acidobacteriia bacterium]|nr:hypothetical protein [Terriglobia bacterium]
MSVLHKSLTVLFLFFMLSTTLPAQFVGSKNSSQYHRPSCQWAQMIKLGSRITFKTAKEAEAAGFVACKVCNPKGKKLKI